MPIDAKTIQIFLPDGEPRGIRIAEITTRIVQAVQVPRARLDRIMARPELDHIGVYFLFGEAGERAKPLAYIGQTEDLRTRLKKHHADKEFWTTAVLLVSKTDSFTLAHIKYLEWHAIRQATEAGRYALENGNAGSKPWITEPMEADVLDAFETGSTLLATLGFPLFDPVAGTPSGQDRRVYFCGGQGWQAKGRPTEDGFVVFKASTVRGELSSAMQQFADNKRKALIAAGVLVVDGGVFRFTEDYLFDTPSGAATVVQGRNSNGWMEWKTADGRTLHEVERAEVQAAEETREES